MKAELPSDKEVQEALFELRAANDALADANRAESIANNARCEAENRRNVALKAWNAIAKRVADTEVRR